MLATVGLSPVPVALAALTVKPELLVLLHSADSEQEAAQIAAVIEDMTAGATGVECAAIGPGNDFVQTHRGMVAAVVEHVPEGVPYLLAYNGGTAAMVACAV